MLARAFIAMAVAALGACEPHPEMCTEKIGGALQLYSRRCVIGPNTQPTPDTAEAWWHDHHLGPTLLHVACHVGQCSFFFQDALPVTASCDHATCRDLHDDPEATP